MRPGSLPVRCIVRRRGGSDALRAPTALRTIGPSGLARLVPVHRPLGTVHGASIRIPSLRACWLGAVGTSLRGHDVSGTGWPMPGRAMQPITTMTPVRQCGHSRKDRPVSASNRSR